MKIVSMLVACLCLATGQNLLRNPGFETWTASMPDYWTKDDSVVIKRETAVIHGGSSSARDSLITQDQDRADFWQGPFGVNQNTQYIFSVWVRENDPAGRLRQVISWHTASGWEIMYANQYSANSSAWQQLSFGARSPAGADSAVASVRAYDSSAAWDGGAVFIIDDAVFAAAAAQPPVIIRTWHKPTNPGAGTSTDVYCRAIDNGTITADTVFYGVNGLGSPQKLTHTAVAGDTFKYLLPGQAAASKVYYYLKFTDNTGQSTVSDTHCYYCGLVNVFINEVYYDAAGSDSGCFIELRGPAGKNLNGVSLVGVNGDGGTDYAAIDLSGHLMPADGFFVAAQNPWVHNADTVTGRADLQNGPDNLELRYQDVAIDALGYGAEGAFVFTGEWRPAHDVGECHSLGRYPDGHDTDNNAVDFLDYDTITPGLPNPVVSVGEWRGKALGIFKARNPVRPSSAVNEIIADAGDLPVAVYDGLGRQVKVFARAGDRLALPRGVYFFRRASRPGGFQKIVVVD